MWFLRLDGNRIQLLALEVQVCVIHFCVTWEESEGTRREEANDGVGSEKVPARLRTRCEQRERGVKVKQIWFRSVVHSCVSQRSSSWKDDWSLEKRGRNILGIAFDCFQKLVRDVCERCVVSGRSGSKRRKYIREKSRQWVEFLRKKESTERWDE